ncbi:hypothetical protein [Paenibacillus sanfengchensis]|uniref:hypothetical protein n=1 Tax=Paenibacillus sanfengchensis TaxID=3119819 RepID=UPI002FE1C370
MNNNRLTRIELFAFSGPPSFVIAARGSQECWYCILKLSCGDCSGFGACPVSTDGKGFDLIKWGDFLRSIRNQSVEEALEIVRSKGSEWLPGQLALVRSALLDTALSRQSRLKAAAGAEYKRSLFSNRPWNAAQLIHESIAYFSIL